MCLAYRTWSHQSGKLSKLFERQLARPAIIPLDTMLNAFLRSQGDYSSMKWHGLV